jgi:hypothetical protein
LTNKEPYRKLRDNTWVVTVQENSEDKDLYIELPPESLKQMGWHEDDTLEWEIVDEGIVTAIIKKKGDSND